MKFEQKERKKETKRGGQSKRKMETETIDKTLASIFMKTSVSLISSPMRIKEANIKEAKLLWKNLGTDGIHIQMKNNKNNNNNLDFDDIH